MQFFSVVVLIKYPRDTFGPTKYRYMYFFCPDTAYKNIFREELDHKNIANTKQSLSTGTLSMLERGIDLLGANPSTLSVNNSN